MFGSLGLPELVIFVSVLFFGWAAPISFIVWLSKANGQIKKLYPGVQKYSTLGVVVACLLPLVNLVLPFQIAKEIWIKSDQAAVRCGSESQGRPEDSIVSIWWLSFVLMHVFATVFFVFLSAEHHLVGFLFVLWMVSIAGSALAAIEFISKIERMQTAALAGMAKGT